MHGPELAPRGAPMGRWITIAVLILVTIGLFFWFAPRTEPAAPPDAVVAP
ncbi:MAG TPA: hypothetical protein VEB59_04375 [Gemmatimonadales bacterium]|nr:hypothetical protein [Gemmatimonadales bacterium]